MTERFLFAHIEMVSMRDRWVGSASFLRVIVFVGDNNNDIITLLAPPTERVAWNAEDALKLLRVYDDWRKWLKGLRWKDAQHVASHRDWLFRAPVIDSNHEAVEWAKRLQPWGVDAQKLWDALRGEAAQS